ncbi:hypothetical protein Golax_022586 [Gossypium laxum]|uniref:DUF7745 domain-containing protein n=1 Tax=Gossypium laxum TaxID=34288 RepID=A0A7J9B0B7_9ROSI|nr:hypothetical protein [Gossypium laxum]
MTVGHTLLSESEKLHLREVFTSARDSESLLGYICTYVFVRFSSPHGHREMYSPELNSVCDSLTKGYVSKLWDFTRISIVQNDLREMKEIWDQWDDEIKKLFYFNYSDLLYLLSIKVDKHLFRDLAQFWNPAFTCFTFGKVDLVPTVEEYTTLLRCPKIQIDKTYSRAASVPTNFPKALRHLDESVSDLIDRLSKEVTPVPAILAETFRSLNACRRAGEGRFIGCAQLLLAWFHSHFWKVEKVSYRNLRDEDVEWRAPWLIPDEILYRCGDFDWVPLLKIWGAIRYAPLLVSRQYRSRQFIPAMQGLAQCEFSYKGNNYKKKVREMSNAWNQTLRIKVLAVGLLMTPEYSQWCDQRVNDNIPVSNPETARSLEEHLQVIPSEMEIIKQDFEKRSLELGRKAKQLEKEKTQLGLDVDVQKLEADKLRKGKNKAEKDLDSLKTDYKKLRRSMRTAGLGKTSKQW